MRHTIKIPQKYGVKEVVDKHTSLVRNKMLWRLSFGGTIWALFNTNPERFRKTADRQSNEAYMQAGYMLAIRRMQKMEWTDEELAELKHSTPKLIV